MLDIKTLTDSVEQLQRGGQFAAAALKTIGPSIGTLPDLEAPDWTAEGVTAGTSFTSALTGVMQRIPGIFKNAFEGGGGIMGAIGSILIDLANEIGSIIAERISAAIAGGISGGTSGRGGGATGTAVQGAVGVGTNAAIGAAGITGAVATAAVTMGISLAVIGAIALYKAKHMTEWKKLGKDIGRDFGVEMSKAALKEMEKDSKQYGRQIAELLNMNKIREAAGTLENRPLTLPELASGQTIATLDTFTSKLRDVFVLYKNGTMTAAQAVEVLDENWAEMAEAGTDANGRLSAGLKEVVQLTIESGLASKEVAEWMRGQGTAALTGFSDIVTGSVLNTTEALSDMGIMAIASINAAVKAGMSMPEALRAAGPALKLIMDGYAALGLNIDNAALKTLLFQSTIMEGNPQLIAAIDGLSGSMIALDNLGALNAETFGAMERTGFAMYTRLQAASANMGGTTADALIPMQKWLHDARDQAALLGIPLDANTQMLIDQSKELGIWKADGLDATTKMTNAMDRVATSLEGILVHMQALVDIEIPDKTFTARGVYELPADSNKDDPNHQDGQRTEDQQSMASFARGTRGQLVDFGAKGTLVTLHNRERVQTEAEVKAGSNIVDIRPLLEEQQRMRGEMRGLRDFFTNRFDKQLARSVRDEGQKAARR